MTGSRRVSVRRVAVTTAIGLAAIYSAAVMLIQRPLLFPRPSLAGAPERPPDAVQVWLASGEASVEAWYLPPAPDDSAPTPVLIFFHGNAELIDHMPHDFEKPRRWGVGVLLVEYPGYGRSSGSPSEESCTFAALAAYDWVKSNASVDSSRIVAYGRSLGGAVAIALAKKRELAALVVESSFASVAWFAHRFGVPEFAVLDPFDSVTALKGYSDPVLIIHGEQDEIVPLHHGQELAQAARRSEFQRLSCGHNDCPRPWPIVYSFLVANGVLRARAT
jgi:uncharacterized protein